MSAIELSAYLLTGALSGLLAGLLGLGGGVIVVPSLILLYGYLGFVTDWIPHMAVGTSLATIIGTGAASTFAHHRRGAVRWDLFLGLAPWIGAGALVGAGIAGVLPQLWLQRLFGVFLLYVGVRMLWRRSGPAAEGKPPGILALGLSGTGIGALSSLVGIGGGTLTVPFLNRSGLDMRRAVATSSACGLPIAVAGAIGFVVAGWSRDGLPIGSTGFVYWPAVGGILLASVPMAPVGARLAHTLPTITLKRIFGVLVLLMGGKLLAG
jgi:uncharacterized membrane protein YfcA